MVSQETFGEAQSCPSVVTDFALRWTHKLPAQKTGGLYKSSPAVQGGFVEAIPFTVSVHGEPSRAFRNGMGIFAVRLGHDIPVW
jgi:hypothetical protein